MLVEKAGRVKGKKNMCSNCKHMGHNRRSCNNQTYVSPVADEVPNTGKPPSTDPWCKHRREKGEQNKVARVAVRDAAQASQATNLDMVGSQASQLTTTSSSRPPHSPSHMMSE
ncbi:hypothetical protein BVRB_3g059600 [Beta vulgaris subsp. vulgaris]|nr:hypothetical protein BVRB_3g059600 [Beta vulgaris subsp. vulgaris]